MMLLHSFSFAFTAVLLEHFLGLNPHAAWHLGGKKKNQGRQNVWSLGSQLQASDFIRRLGHLQCCDGGARRVERI